MIIDFTSSYSMHVATTSIEAGISYLHNYIMPEKWPNGPICNLNKLDIRVHIYTKQKHLGCKKGKANQKQQLSDYKSIHSYTCD